MLQIKHFKSGKIVLLGTLICLALTSTLVYSEPVSTKPATPMDLYAPLLVNTTDPITLNLEQKIAKTEQALTRTKRVESLLGYLKKVGSPIATQHYAELIVDLSQQSKSDYRVIVAIMGTESGFCKKPIHYNCFGYLNGVKYDSFDAAFKNLIPKISKQYVNKYGWNFTAFAKAYGQMGEHAAGNLSSIANKLYY
jgi:hypothetical protein